MTPHDMPSRQSSPPVLHIDIDIGNHHHHHHHHRHHRHHHHLLAEACPSGLAWQEQVTWVLTVRVLPNELGQN